ncbi:hypothetical protein GCM10023203_13990 [Actinomycetospora straminea]|uniref:Replication initiator protein n=2 Tax=Actinomycetospora straminea TaxID=663607 RepID=A0ABP9E2S0_9PSEU
MTDDGEVVAGASTPAERSVLPMAADVARAMAAEHGVCIRPVALRRIDTQAGRTEVVPVACGSTREDVCGPCAVKARTLRMAQCREGWHLDEEPDLSPREPTDEEKEIVGARADLVVAYRAARERGDDETAEELAEQVEDLDEQLRALGVRGRLAPLDPPERARRKRSTRRRQDAPNLPRRPVEDRTVGQTFGAGRYRPSTFVTWTLGSYGRVREDGTPVDPASYDYRRAARDAIHFAALLDRLWQNTRRCVGWEVQYFGTVEPQRRGAPHFHAAVRGSISRTDVRAITEATYHQVWWPAHDQAVHTADRPPQWDAVRRVFTDPDTGTALPSWDDACDAVTEPAHVVRFGEQVHVKGILGGTEDAGRHIGYLTKYLTKSVSHAARLSAAAKGEEQEEQARPVSDRQRAHARRLHAELAMTPCSPRCAVWLLYGVTPKGAGARTTPGVCRGKAHRAETLGLGGRRVLVSRKWSGKTLDDHRADRTAFVRQLLADAGITPTTRTTTGDPAVRWEPTRPNDPDVPGRPVLLLAAIAERQRWRAEYTAAQLAASGDLPCSAIDGAAA